MSLQTRKRSGAFYSDSEEEYLRLASISQSQEESQSRKRPRLSQTLASAGLNVSLYLKGFNMEPKDEYEMEDQGEKQQEKRTQQEVVIVAADIASVKRALVSIDAKRQSERSNTMGDRENKLPPEPIQSGQGNKIDLHIRIKQSQNHCSVFKYWLISEEYQQEPLCRGYVQRATVVYRFTNTSGKEIKEATKGGSTLEGLGEKALGDSTVGDTAGSESSSSPREVNNQHFKLQELEERLEGILLREGGVQGVTQMIYECLEEQSSS